MKHCLLVKLFCNSACENVDALSARSAVCFLQPVLHLSKKSSWSSSRLRILCLHAFDVHQHTSNRRWVTTLLPRGLQTCLSNGHMALHNCSRAGHLTQCDSFAICYILLNQQKFRKIFFLLLTKCLRGPDEMVSRAGFVPRAVVWIPRLSITGLPGWLFLAKFQKSGHTSSWLA